MGSGGPGIWNDQVYELGKYRSQSKREKLHAQICARFHAAETAQLRAGDGRGKMSETFTFRSKMPASAEEVYRFHGEPDALERLTPSWEKVKVIERTGSIEQLGSTVTLRITVGPFTQDWLAEHVACEP